MHYVLIPFAWLLRMLYHLFNNYGVALILFSLITKLILMPFTAKSKKSMMKTSRLGPKLKELEAKCGDDKMKYQQEMQALYKKEGVSPMSGCLWSLLPLVLLMALYYVIRQPMTYLMQLSADQITQIQDYMTSSGLVELATSGRGSYYTEIVLAQAVYDNMDAIKAIVPDIASRAIDFHFLGVDLSQIPTWRWMFDGPYTLVGFGLFIIPVVSAVLSVVSMIVTNRINASILGTEKVIDQSQRTTMIIMPLFSLWICFTLPAALGVYWIGNSIVAILQEIANMPFLKKHLVKLETEKAARKEAEKERVKQEKKAQAEAKKKAAEEMRRIQMERKLNKSISGASREGLRAYARGRMYDPDRYPTFPYQDPNELIKEKLARLEAEKAAGKKRGKKDKDAVLPASPAQETPKEEAVETAASAVSEPEAPAVEEAGEAFVEESFLEEPENTEK